MNEFSAVHLQRGSHAGAAHMTRGSHVTGAKVIMLGTPVHGLPAQLTPRYPSEGQRTAWPAQTDSEMSSSFFLVFFKKNR